MTPHIVIVGAGQIGSRHLQSLALIDRDVEVSVVDPSVDSLGVAKSRLEELPKNAHLCSVDYFESVDNLKPEIDVAIIATSADIRRSVVERLLQKCLVKYFILEKVAFQSVADFESVMTLLEARGSRAWVNCSYRRMFPFYQELKQSLIPGDAVSLNVWGGGWGLACNSIHFLDLFAFLNGDASLCLEQSHLDRDILPSKRKNFIEFTGHLSGEAKSGANISLFDRAGSATPYVVQIISRDAQHVIFESSGKVLSAVRSKNWVWNEGAFVSLHQSQLTHLVIQELLSSGSCVLAPLAESFIWHKALLEKLTAHLENMTGKRHFFCPVT